MLPSPSCVCPDLRTWYRKTFYASSRLLDPFKHLPLMAAFNDPSEGSADALKQEEDAAAVRLPTTVSCIPRKQIVFEDWVRAELPLASIDRVQTQSEQTVPVCAG